MDIGTALTLTLEVIHNRKPIIDRAAEFFCEKFETDIVLFGNANVGKTTFAELLTSALRKRHFSPPKTHSSDIEHYIIRINKETRPKKLIVMPSQVSQESYIDGVRNNLLNNRTSGLLYMVDWGLNTPRKKDSELRMVSLGKTKITDLLDDNKADEIKHLRTTLTYSSMSKIDWVIFIINKCDLFPNQIGEALNYYIQTFKPLIDEFIPGKKISFLPMISHKNPISFNGDVINSVTTDYNQEQMLNDFIKQITEFNAG